MKSLQIDVRILDQPEFRAFLERLNDFITEYAWYNRDCLSVDMDGVTEEGEGRKLTTKQSPEEHRDQVLLERFGSAITLSVKVLRPANKYPYEHEIWTSEIRVPVMDHSDENVQAIVEAWVQTMEAGIALAQAFGESGFKEQQ